MQKSLLLLACGLTFCSASSVASSPRSVSFGAPISQINKNGVKVSKSGDIRFQGGPASRQQKVAAPKSGNNDDLYNVEVLLSENFSALGAGNMDDPTAVPITEDNGDLKGLPGWSGVNVFDAGQAVYVDVKFVIDEEWGWGEAEGEIWTPAVRDVAGKTLRLKADVKGVSDDEDIFDSMNCVFMAYTDDIPGERGMIDFPYFNITTDFETHEVSVDVPETMTFYNEDDEEVECPVSAVRVKMQPMETPFFISDLELAAVSPKVAVPQDLTFCNFSADGYTAVWTAVEGADRYSVDFFTAEFNAEEFEFMLTLHSSVETSSNSADVTIPTGDPTFFCVTAFAGGQPSPVSDMQMVYSALPPKMREAVISDGKVSVSWTPAEGAAGTEIFAYRQLSVGESGKDYKFLDLDFSGASDSEDGDEVMWLDDYAYGWVALPYPSIEDGAVTINNSGAMWGMPSAKLISSNTYDFSQVTGKVKMIVTARTPDYCGMVVAMGGTDSATGETLTLDAAATDLTTEFVDYEFELEGSNAETLFLVQADNSLGTLAVRRIRIIADFPDGSEIGYPYFSDYTEGESLTFDTPDEEYQRVKVVGRTVKQITVEEMGYTFTIAEAVSAYSDPVFAGIGLGVSAVQPVDSTVEFFSIDGRRLGCNAAAASGLYIEKSASGVTKRIVR